MNFLHIVYRAHEEHKNSLKIFRSKVCVKGRYKIMQNKKLFVGALALALGVGVLAPTQAHAMKKFTRDVGVVGTEGPVQITNQDYTKAEDSTKYSRGMKKRTRRVGEEPPEGVQVRSPQITNQDYTVDYDQPAYKAVERSSGLVLTPYFTLGSGSGSSGQITNQDYTSGDTPEGSVVEQPSEDEVIDEPKTEEPSEGLVNEELQEESSEQITNQDYTSGDSSEDSVVEQPSDDEVVDEPINEESSEDLVDEFKEDNSDEDSEEPQKGEPSVDGGVVEEDIPSEETPSTEEDNSSLEKPTTEDGSVDPELPEKEKVTPSPSSDLPEPVDETTKSAEDKKSIESVPERQTQDAKVYTQKTPISHVKAQTGGSASVGIAGLLSAAVGGFTALKKRK